MSQTEIEQALIEIIGAILERPVPPTISRETEPAWDSLKHMQIVFAVEEKFGVQFTEAEIPQLDSIGSFTRHLERHYAA